MRREEECAEFYKIHTIGRIYLLGELAREARVIVVFLGLIVAGCRFGCLIN